MRYIEALDSLPGPVPHDTEKTTDTLFLAGGITGCPDWQAKVVERLSDMDDLTILNPRRANFPIDDPKAARKQIEWEHQHMNRANVFMFWFPEETLCPITLFELGVWVEKAPLLFVGTHPNYARKQDVKIQTRLRRHKDQKIYYDLTTMTNAFRMILTTDWSLI